LLFANFSEALAEGRGKAQAEALRKTRQETQAQQACGQGLSPGRLRAVSSTRLAQGDLYLVETGDVLPADGEVVEGIASVDESAVTGESAPGDPRVRRRPQRRHGRERASSPTGWWCG
jgi:K+-transporting ATPase ATPase B chain